MNLELVGKTASLYDGTKAGTIEHVFENDSGMPSAIINIPGQPKVLGFNLTRDRDNIIYICPKTIHPWMRFIEIVVLVNNNICVRLHVLDKEPTDGVHTFSAIRVRKALGFMNPLIVVRDFIGHGEFQLIGSTISLVYSNKKEQK